MYIGFWFLYVVGFWYYVIVEVFGLLKRENLEININI